MYIESVRYSVDFFGANIQVVASFQIRGARGKSLESLEGQGEEQQSYTTFSTAEVQIHRPMVLAPGPGPACWRPRSYDDGDITPTNEMAMAVLHEGGGTLPRPRGLAKPRPVAKVGIEIVWGLIVNISSSNNIYWLKFCIFKLLKV